MRILRFEGVLAGSNRHPGRLESDFPIVTRPRLPSLEHDGIVSLVITVMEIDQIRRPHITPLGVIIEIGNLFKVLTIVCQ